MMIQFAYLAVAHSAAIHFGDNNGYMAVRVESDGSIKALQGQPKGLMNTGGVYVELQTSNESMTFKSDDSLLAKLAWEFPEGVNKIKGVKCDSAPRNLVSAARILGRQPKGAVPPCTLDPTTSYAIITGEASRRAAAGRAQPLAKFGRRGMGRFPRKCKVRGPCGVACG